MATTNQVERKVLPDDILAAMFAIAKEMGGKERLEFRGHDSDLQKAFYSLTDLCKCAVLEPFVFSDSGPEPYSPVLTEAISRLQLSGLVGRNNPDYEILFLNRSAEEYFKSVLKNRFSSEELSQLEKAAAEFIKLVPPR